MNTFRRKRSIAIITTVAMLFSLFMVTPTEKVYAEPDIIPPVIHGDTLTKTLPEGKTTVTVGDTVYLSVKITDNTAVQGGYVRFWNSETSKLKDCALIRHENTDFWTFRFDVTEDTANGEWKISFINAYDFNNNSITVQNHPDHGQDLGQNGIFTVEGTNADTEVPVIYGDTLTKTLPEGKTTVTVGDTAYFSVKITDNTAVQGGYVRFWNSEASKLKDCALIRHENTDFWTFRFDVTEDTANGEWKISFINAYDFNNNSITVQNHPDHGQDLGQNGIFTVEGTNADTEVPVIYGDTLTKTLPEGRTALFVGDTVHYSVKITDNTAVQGGYVRFWNSEASKLKDCALIRHENTDSWTFCFDVTENTASGEWKISFINAYDFNNNSVTVQNHPDYGQDLNEGDITVLLWYSLGEVTLSVETYTYDGEPKTPTVTVKNENGESLTEGRDYDVTYTDNVLVGTAQVTVTGMGQYWGTITKTFVIEPAPLGEVTLPNETYTYDGEPKTPTVTVKNEGGKSLTEGRDYDVTYTDNVLVGTAQVTVTGTGQYCGTVTKTFVIEPAPLGDVTLSNDTYVYNGEPKTPTVTVKNEGGETLTEGRDYNVTYSDNINVGTAQVTVTGTGQYYGTVSKTFIIKPIQYLLGDVTLSDETYTYDGEPKTPTITVKNENEETLTEGRDYDVIYIDNTNVGIAQVTVTGAGQYSGTITKTFIIKPGKVKVGVKLYGHDDLHATWNPLPAGEGVTVKYKVEYKRSTRKEYRELTPGTTKTYYKKPNLVDGAKYRFKVTPYAEIDGVKYEGEPGYSPYIYTLKKISAPKMTKSSKYYVRARWTNIPGESGYQIARSRYKTKNFSIVKTVSSKYSTTTIKTPRNKTYYYKIRAYKTVDGKRIYAPWSAVKAYRLR